MVGAPHARGRRPLSHERRVLVFSILAGLPGSLVALIFLWTGDQAARTQWTLTLFIVGLWLGFVGNRSLEDCRAMKWSMTTG